MATLIQALIRAGRGRGVTLCALVACALAMVITFAGAAPLALPPSRTLEYELKAAAIYNLLAFIEWPAESFANDTAPLVIGILGEGPVADLLPRVIENETVRGRSLVIQRYATAAQVHGCHLLFLGRFVLSDGPVLQMVLLPKRLLIVSDHDDFARSGGAIQVSVLQNKLRLVVNVTAAHEAGVTLSAKLLRLAEVIGERKP